jgi:glycosyltransferase involved in cell wall biosynthesis
MMDQEKLPAIMPAPISAIIVACNDEATVERVVDSWAAYLDGLGSGYEILLVDDGSTDRTQALAVSLAERRPSLRLLRYNAHQGFGAALRTALANANHPLLLYALADNLCPVGDVRRAFKWIDDVHLVAGLRVWQARPCRRTWRDRFTRWLARWVFGVRMRDPGCLFALARRAIFARIPIQANGPFAHTEVLAKANFLGCLVTEIPYTSQPQRSGESALAPFRLRQTLAEAHRLFHHPDFGPPKLPESAIVERQT